MRDQLKCGHIFSFISFYDFYPNRKKVFSHFYPTRCAIDFFGLTHTHTRADRGKTRGKLSLNQVEYFKAAQIEKLSTWPTQPCIAASI